MELKVNLINKQEFENDGLFKKWGEFACICYDTPLEKALKVGKHCFNTGHYSGSRHIFFAFHIDLPRSSADQIVRHQDGVVKNMQSQRYVNKSNFTYYTSPDIKNNEKVKDLYEKEMENIKKAYIEIIESLKEVDINGEHANEQARGILPMDIESKLALALNIEGLIHLAHKRLCLRTQEHTRKITKLIVDEAIKAVPELKEHLVPECQYLLWCPENYKKCPLMKSNVVLSKEDLRTIIKDYKECYLA